LFRLWNPKWGESHWYDGIKDGAAWIWNQVSGPVKDLLVASLISAVGALVAMLGGSSSPKVDKDNQTDTLSVSRGELSSAQPQWSASCVSRRQGFLDLFMTGSDGLVRTTGRGGSSWSVWSQVAGGVAQSCSPVTVVSRGPDKLDAFVVGTDNGIWTAAWEPSFTDGWHGWWRIGDVKAPLGAYVGAISRSLDHLDIFITDVGGQILTAAWEPAFTDGWHGWWPIAGGVAAPGSPVTVVSRGPDKLDVFVVGTDSGIRSAAWEPGFTDGWHGWWQIAGGVAAPGSPVTVVSRGPDKLDAFVVGTDEGIWTAAWEPDFTDGWHGWWQIGSSKAPLGAYVGAVSRSLDHLDAFVTDVGGRILTAAWEPGFTDGWHGWWQIAGGVAAPGSPVTAVSSSPNTLDAFVVGKDGAARTAAWEPTSAGGWHGWQTAGTLPPLPKVS
jgi:hypothetical protein